MTNQLTLEAKRKAFPCGHKLINPDGRCSWVFGGDDCPGFDQDAYDSWVAELIEAASIWLDKDDGSAAYTKNPQDTPEVAALRTVLQRVEGK